jgi:hypothetical protein
MANTVFNFKNGYEDIKVSACDFLMPDDEVANFINNEAISGKFSFEYGTWDFDGFDDDEEDMVFINFQGNDPRKTLKVEVSNTSEYFSYWCAIARSEAVITDFELITDEMERHTILRIKG